MTRGAWGFRKDGDLKVLYNGHDSYPAGLGKDILFNTDHLYGMYLRLIPVEESPDHLAIEDSSFDEVCKLYQWISGNIYFENQVEFLHDKIFCEYAYIVDLDKDELDFYVLSEYKTTYDIKDLDSSMIDHIVWDMASY